MKKFFALTGIILPVIFLCACSNFSSNIAKKQPNLNFSSNITITSESQVIEGKITREDNSTTIEVTSPETMEGISFSRTEDDKYLINYNNLSFETTGSIIPSESVIYTVIDVLDISSDSENIKVISDENNVTVYLGKCNSGEFKLRINSDNGIVQKIEVPDLSLSAVFAS